ncbi:hypothetical protein [Nocardioides pacificus]
MSRFDTARRGISLVLAVLCLLVVPELASAKFQGQATATQSVGTLELAKPTSVEGSFRCTNLFVVWEVVDVNTTKVTHANPTRLAYTYKYELLRGDKVERTLESASPTVHLQDSMGLGWSTTTWTVRVYVKHGSWTSREPWEKSFTCKSGFDQGPL